MINTLERGGTERQFVTLANAASAFQVYTGCLARKGEFLDSLPDIREFSPAGCLFGLQSQLARVSLARLLRSRRIAVAHAFDFYANLMLIPAARMARVPVVIGSHRQLGDLQKAGQFWVQNLCFRLCDRVVCNSRAAADRLRQAGLPGRKLIVIPNALPDTAFVPATPALAIVRNQVRIGMIARMNHPAKNHRLFLRVASRLAARFSNVEFVLVGDGPLRPELEVYARACGLGTRLQWLGDRNDVPVILAALDITVLPSSSESLSNVILESMAAGVPVVAADVGGNSELIQDGQSGSLVPMNDDVFVEAVARLLVSPELRREFGERGRTHAKAHHRLGLIRQQYEQLYKSLLDSRGWGRQAGRVGVAA
jgi:glycosyltransferase involved in cell wall biosynthesis